MVAATGVLQNDEEKKWMVQQHSAAESEKQGKQQKHAPVKKEKQGKPQKSNPVKNDVGTKTLRFKQDSVHDFAWFADKEFIVAHDTIVLASGRIVDAYSFHLPKEKTVLRPGKVNAPEATPLNEKTNIWRNSIALY